MNPKINHQHFVPKQAHNFIIKRYSLAKLLVGVSAEDIAELNKKVEWATSGKSVGRELV